MPERGSIIESHPTEFFRELVRAAMQAQNVTLGRGDRVLPGPASRAAPPHPRRSPGSAARARVPRGEQRRRRRALPAPEARRRHGPVRRRACSPIASSARWCSRTTTSRSAASPTIAWPGIGSRQVRAMFADLAGQFLDLVRVLGEISTRDLFVERSRHAAHLPQVAADARRARCVAAGRSRDHPRGAEQGAALIATRGHDAPRPTRRSRVGPHSPRSLRSAARYARGVRSLPRAFRRRRGRGFRRACGRSSP